MSTKNERAAKQGAKTDRSELQSDVYDPHFPTKRYEPRRDRSAVFHPHFPTRSTAKLGG